MNTIALLLIIFSVFVKDVIGQIIVTSTVDMVDLTIPVWWKDMQNYYEKVATQKQRKICVNCGFPEMGTTIHYQYYGENALKPADIPVPNLLTKLVVIDLSSITKSTPNLVLTLEDARRWLPVEQGLYRPTLLLFKFGWTGHQTAHQHGKCLCQIPGISFDLAAWIAVTLNHVVGVATDAPSLESEQTRNSTARTVSALLGKSGVYIIENIDARQNIPETGCLAMVTPLKLLDENYVPARVTAFCPPSHKEKVEVIMASRQH